MNVTDLPRIAITMGDPSGVGAEVILKALLDPDIAPIARFVIVGDAWVLEENAVLNHLPMLSMVPFDDTWPANEASISVLDQKFLRRSDFAAGEISAAGGAAAAHYIRTAVQLCLDGKANAITTAPVNKEAVVLAGIPFTGHTEYIAELCGGADTRMLLVNSQLRVVHVTTHCSLHDASLSDTHRILQTIELGHQAVRSLGIERPRIAVCGLNPHAGEHGLFGSEDQEAIVPAVEAARAQRIDCSGPFAADTLFFKAVRGEYDLVVAMYHDQGHIPMKLIDFEHTVNVSLGLPIIRTSVDHGTAFDIVGKNIADCESMKAALRLAAALSTNRMGAKNA